MKLKIAYRLATAFGFTLFMVLLLTGYSVSQVNTVGNSLSLINDVNSVKQRYAINFRGSVHDRAIILRDLILIQQDHLLEQELQDFRLLEENYADSAKRLDELFASYHANSEEEITALEAIKDIERQTNPVVAQVKALRLSGELANAQELMMTSAKPLFIEWLRRINVFIDLKEAENNAITEQTRALTSGFAQISWLITLLAIALGGIAAWLISRSILKPLRYAVDHAGCMAKGDMSQHIELSGADETTELLEALYHLQQETRKTMFEIQHTADQLQRAAADLAEVTVKGAGAANAQNHELQLAAAAINDMLGSVETVNNNAESTSEATSAAKKSADSSAEHVVFTVKSLQQMIEETSKTAEVMNNLSNKSLDIGKVLDVIGSLAEQTNLLALNAAIEAARAGEAGRGFAVVADEVRNLASKTQASTTSISQIIEDIQLGITNAVKAVDLSCEIGNETAQLANEAASSLNTIQQEITVINEKNGDIADSVNNQVHIASNVADAVNTVKKQALEVEQIAENTQQTSQDLESLAASLVTSVNRFKT